MKRKLLWQLTLIPLGIALPIGGVLGWYFGTNQNQSASIVNENPENPSEQVEGLAGNSEGVTDETDLILEEIPNEGQIPSETKPNEAEKPTQDTTSPLITARKVPTISQPLANITNDAKITEFNETLAAVVAATRLSLASEFFKEQESRLIDELKKAGLRIVNFNVADESGKIILGVAKAGGLQGVISNIVIDNFTTYNERQQANISLIAWSLLFYKTHAALKADSPILLYPELFPVDSDVTPFFQMPFENGRYYHSKFEAKVITRTTDTATVKLKVLPAVANWSSRTFVIKNATQVQN